MIAWAVSAVIPRDSTAPVTSFCRQTPFIRRLKTAAVVAYVVAGNASNVLAGGGAVCPECLGVSSDGFLGLCTGVLSCVSSQDDNPMTFLEPWEYDPSIDSTALILRKIESVIVFEGGQVVEKGDRYLRAEFRVGKIPGLDPIVDDFEVYLTKNDATVQFRSARRGGVRLDGGENRRRTEKIRKKCGFTSLPVLRGRTKVLGIFESPFDSFGPTTSQTSDDDLIDQEMRIMSL